MNQLQPLIDIALAQVGTHEEGGNNKGPMIVEYQKATWLAPAPYPWCAAFMCWCLQQFLAGSYPLFVTNVEDIEKWRCRNASAFGWIKWATNKGLTVLDNKQPAKAGDIVVFTFSHIGLVTDDQLPGKDYIETVEGNSSSHVVADSGQDGVWKHQRSISLVRNYIRLINQDVA